jgi:hypothetical protein
MALMRGKTEEENITELLNWAVQPAGPQIGELERAIIENEEVSEAVKAECEVELSSAARTGYSTSPR